MAVFFVGCSAAPDADVAIVDVVVSSPSATTIASTVASSVVPAATVAVDPQPSEMPFDLDANPRRVLRPPPPPTLATTSSLPPPSAAPLSQANQAVLGPLLGQRSVADAASMTPEGPAIGGSFKQGDTLHLALNLQPGRCYTLIAVSKSISELDIDLMFSPTPGMPFPPTMVAKDATSGSVAVLGQGANCFKNPMPIPFPAVAVVRATSGAGAAMVQAFSR